MVDKWHCRGCGDTLQEFQDLDDEEEKKYLRQWKPKYTSEASYTRWTREGSRGFQRRGDWNDGGFFPEKPMAGGK